MKITQLFLVVCLFGFKVKCHGQDIIPNWINAESSSDNEENFGISRDNLGNVLVTGRFSGTVDFDPSASSFNLTSNGLTDLYVAKYSNLGQLMWVFNIGGLDVDGGHSIKIDNANNILVTGYIRGPNVDCDPSSNIFLVNGQSYTGTNFLSSGDIFVAKYTTNGDFIWAFTVPNTYWQNSGYAIDVDVNNDIYLTGNNNATSTIVSDFDPGPGVFSLSNANDGHAFVAKYNSNGTFIWAFSLGEWGASSSGCSISVDPNDSTFYLAGHVTGSSVDFDPGPGTTLFSTLSNDIFLAKYSKNKQLIWANVFGNTAIDVCRSLLFYDSCLYLTGRFGGNVDFDPSSQNYVLNALNAQDIFVAKYNTNGNFIWAHGIGSANHSDEGYSVVDINNQILVGGYFGGIVDFDPSASTHNLSSNGGLDMFMVRFDTSGNFLCGSNIGSVSNDYLYSLFCDNVDTFYSAGSYGGTVDFDPGPNSLTVNNLGGNDGFLSQYKLNIASSNYTASISGGPFCSGQMGYFTVNLSPSYSGSFSVTYTLGSNTFTVNNAQSGIPISIGLITGNTTINFQNISINPILSCYSPQIALPPPYQILVNSSPTVQISSTSNISCSGSPITASANGAFSYVWSGGIQNNIPFVPTTNSSYTVIGTDVNGCTNSAVFSVQVGTTPSVGATVNPSPVCEGNATIFNGTGAASYSWTGGVLNNVPFYPTASGTYTVTGSDQVGCTSTSLVNLIVDTLPFVSANSSPLSVCANGSITLIGSGALVYLWSGGATNNIPFVPSTSGTYTVTGIDANGCSNTSTVEVQILPSLNILINNPNPIICEGDSTVLTAVVNGGQFYTWSPSIGLSSNSGTSVWAFPMQSTTYTVTGIDINGCSGSASTLVSITPQINISVTKSNDIECEKPSTQLMASGATSYSWTPGNLLSNPNIYNPIATPTQSTLFIVKGIKATCSDTASIWVEVTSTGNEQVFIPTAFTPNHDDLNDCLRVKINSVLLDYYFVIYNRWGQQVFESSDPNRCWNGQFKNEDAELGTYYYFLKFKSSCGTEFFKGDITLIR